MFFKGGVRVLLVRNGNQVDIDAVLNKVIGGECAFPAKSIPTQQIGAQLSPQAKARIQLFGFLRGCGV